jgi:hypothetical protein
MVDVVSEQDPERRNTAMIRKSILALAAVAALGLGALATSTEASAKPWGFKSFHGHHFHGHRHWGVRYIDVGPDCYWMKRLTRFGTVKLVKVCSY